MIYYIYIYIYIYIYYAFSLKGTTLRGNRVTRVETCAR